MKSRWSDSVAAQLDHPLQQRVYTSRLLGSDPSLVLHGGGNTSVKIRETNVFGEEEDILYVKSRGANLATIEASGFSPCRLRHLQRLATLESLSDEQMENELRASLSRADAPAPSVETLLHAILPARFVDHTHADALIAIMNTPTGPDRVRELYGEQVMIVPYEMPGFRLVRFCQEVFAKYATTRTVGLVLLHHGVFTFGETAKSSYERMIDLVHRAEQYLASHEALLVEWVATHETPAISDRSDDNTASRLEISKLRGAISAIAGFPMILATHTDPQGLGFARHPDVAKLSQRGGITPDHVIRTKRVPLVGRDVAGYQKAYEAYVERLSGGRPLADVDPAPRVVLDAELGLCVAGRSAEDAAFAEDIYRHTIDTIMRAEKLGGWCALSARDFFEVEYWDLERAKLAKAGSDPPFLGEVALVTGAASGIGKACVESLLARGAAVAGLDVSPSVQRAAEGKSYLGLQCDLAVEQQTGAALDRVVRTFGSIDMLVLNAGIFPKSSLIAAMPTEIWRKTLSINLDANLVLLRECHPLLKIAPRGGRVVVIGSKNVAAPGPGASAYSASKAAVQQLARVAALEWGKDGIRVNTVHPNAVFDTGIWKPDVLAARAASYNLTVDEYKTNNVLKVEVTSRDVAELAAELCGPVFSKTTGAQIPVDGGNERVI